MPLKDTKNELAIRAIKLRNKVITPLQKVPLPVSNKNANRLISRAKVTYEEDLSRLIDSINEAIADNQYYISASVGKRNKRKLFTYFKQKKFFVITFVEPTTLTKRRNWYGGGSDNILISWLGGKTWRFNQEVTNIDKAVSKVFQSLSDIIFEDFEGQKIEQCFPNSLVNTNSKTLVRSLKDSQIAKDIKQIISAV